MYTKLVPTSPNYIIVEDQNSEKGEGYRKLDNVAKRIWVLSKLPELTNVRSVTTLA